MDERPDRKRPDRKRPDRERANRERAERRGRRAEAFAALALQLKGYRIVARNHRTRGGEADIIARRGDVVAIVEVKARASEEAALNAVAPRARRRIASAGLDWASRQHDFERLTLRHDIVAVLPWQWPRHFPNVW